MDARHDLRHQAASITFAQVIGMGANGADLHKAWHVQANARHSHQFSAFITNPDELAERSDERQTRERRLDCLDRCLRALALHNRRLLLRYHHGAGREKIESREHLADELKIPLNALRIRVYRIRSGLEACVAECAGRQTSLMK